MSFELTQDHKDSHREQGITVLRNIIPASLLRDLRREAGKALELARMIHGDQAQRIQPVAHHEDVFDLQVFRNYGQLPQLNDAVKSLIGDKAYYDDLDLMGILVGPPKRTNCMQWHMDVNETTAGVNAQEFKQIRLQPSFGNQVNSPLYQDSFLWFVPGSHKHPAEEESRQIANSEQWYSILERVLDEEQNYCVAQLEKDCLSYMWSMPKAKRIHLEPGDFAIYRPFAWHAAFYSSYQNRVTLHHGVWTPEAFEWWQRMNSTRGPWRDRYERPVTAH